MMIDDQTVYALLAEFREPEDLRAAPTQCQKRHQDIDTYAPYPVEGLPEAIGFRRNRVPLFALIGGIAGGVSMYLLQWYSADVDYPVNAGGRTLHSWPAFVPPTFEITMLGAAIGCFIGMLVLNGLPQLNHPIFDAADFGLASRNRFFLSIRATDPAFDIEETRKELEELRPLRVIEIYS
jgi:hypothetical protein